MYVPAPNVVDDESRLREMVAALASAHLVTSHEGVPDATLLPVLWEGDRVVAHMARANDHWRRIGDGAAGLFVVRDADAYVSPSWYAAKAEHGRVVPTWNYGEVQLRGTVRVVDDHEWLRRAVSALTDRHEEHRAQPWAVTDAPAAFVDGQLRGIVGIEMTVTEVTGKAKLSQNRSAADRAGVVAGLADESPAVRPGAARVRAAMLRQEEGASGCPRADR